MDITVTFVGNATTLISAGGLTLLTDPNFLHRWQHAHLGYGLVSKRLREPALNIDELPIVTTPHAAKRCTTAVSATPSGCRHGSGTQSPRAATQFTSPRCRGGTRRCGAIGCCRR